MRQRVEGSSENNLFTVNDFDGTDDLKAMRGRSESWSHHDYKPTMFDNPPQLGGNFKCTGTMRGGEDSSVDIMQSEPQGVAGRKRRKSYTEMIAAAILSSPQKRLTLAEIYDWMSANVEEYKDQRYVPSSSSWKNAVRHNLSVQSCFKRVKRHGVEKPSWWTVDTHQAAKRRLSLPTVTGNKIKMEMKSARRCSLNTLNSTAGVKGVGIEDYGIVNSAGNVCDLQEQMSNCDQELLNGTDLVATIETNATAENNNEEALASLECNPSLSAYHLAQRWLEQRSVPEAGVVSKDGSVVQTLRVRTSQGVEQNVRFVMPLRLRVVVNCEKAVQTTEQGDNTDLWTQSGMNVGASGCGEYLQSNAQISDNFPTLGNESYCDVSKIMQGDTAVGTSANAYSCPMDLESDFPPCWNAYLNTDDVTVFSSVA